MEKELNHIKAATTLTKESFANHHPKMNRPLTVLEKKRLEVMREHLEFINKTSMDLITAIGIQLK